MDCDAGLSAIANLKEAGRGDAQKYVPTVLYPRVQWGMEPGTGTRRWEPPPSTPQHQLCGPHLAEGRVGALCGELVKAGDNPTGAGRAMPGSEYTPCPTPEVQWGRGAWDVYTPPGTPSSTSEHQLCRHPNPPDAMPVFAPMLWKSEGPDLLGFPALGLYPAESPFGPGLFA